MPVLELSDEQVIAVIQDLPEAQQQRVMSNLAGKKSQRKRPQFGSAKNDILYIAEDCAA